MYSEPRNGTMVPQPVSSHFNQQSNAAFGSRGLGGCCGCGCNCGCGAFCGTGLGYSADEWAAYNASLDGQRTYRWWAEWIPTPEGQAWVANKHCEARRIVDGMIRQWGLDELRSGEGVIDVGGDPGFMAAELLRSGIPVTVVDPGFGQAGKSDAATMAFLADPQHYDRVPRGATPFRVIREPFTQAFVDNQRNKDLLKGVSAIVSLYPDEATDFVLYFTAAKAMRTALIPCNECAQYYPPHNPTYEGFVMELLNRDMNYSAQFGHNVNLRREWIHDTPFCRVLLQRTPPHAMVAQIPRPLSSAGMKQQEFYPRRQQLEHGPRNQQLHSAGVQFNGCQAGFDPRSSVRTSTDVIPRQDGFGHFDFFADPQWPRYYK